jgi:hypothetical protein
MQTLKKGKATHLLVLILITGCAEWNSVPTVVDQNHGRAYTAMVKNQTLCSEHGQKAKDPKLCPEHGPVMAMDGQKAQGNIITYRLSPHNTKTDGTIRIEESKMGAQYSGGTGAMSSSTGSN